AVHLPGDETHRFGGQLAEHFAGSPPKPMGQSFAVDELESLDRGGLCIAGRIHLIPNRPAECAFQAAAGDAPSANEFARWDRDGWSLRRVRCALSGSTSGANLWTRNASGSIDRSAGDADRPTAAASASPRVGRAAGQGVPLTSDRRHGV